MSGTTNQFPCHRTLADFIASDHELLVFRRFDNLNARNLLHLQSELIHLEARLAELDDEDVKDGSMDVMLSARCWEVLETKAHDHPREAERMQILRRIERATYKYNKALVMQSEVLKINAPKKRVWNVFSGWFDLNQPFTGDSKNLLEFKAEFVALKPSSGSDSLSPALEDFVGKFIIFIKWMTNSQKEGPIYYSELAARRIVAALSIIGSTLLLELAIVVLYLQSNDRIRIGLIAVFTTIFATALSLLSHARLTEMFAVTAAYAAVLVVFLSGSLGTHNVKRS